MPEKAYPIRLVARITGISADRLRIWERRYRAIRPRRGRRGRLYSQADVQRILLLREALQCGHLISRISALTDRQLRALVEEGGRVSSTPSGDVAETEEQQLLEPLLDAIKRFNYTRADRELTRVAVLMGGVRPLVHRIILPLMRTIGFRWERGELNVAHEHMISMLLSNLLGSLLRINSPETPAARVLLATPSEERHYFGVLAASLLAASGGLEAICLGGDLPSRDIVTAARKTHSDVVVVAVYGSWPAARYGELRFIATHLPKNMQFWIGGPICRQLVSSLRLTRARALPDFTSYERSLARLGAEI